jgi:hypothetical protein
MNYCRHAIVVLALMSTLCTCAGGDTKSPVVGDAKDALSADAQDVPMEGDTEPEAEPVNKFETPVINI